MLSRISTLIGVIVTTLSLAACTGATSTYITPSEPTILVISVKAIRPTFGSSEDQVYLVTDAGKQAPTGSPNYVSMSAGKIWSPNFFVSTADTRAISLMERDIVGDDDLIGVFSYATQKPAGRYIEKMTGDGSEYEVIFEIKR